MAKHLLETGLIIHCEGADGAGYTLCGYSLDGVAGDQPMTETKASINCEECIRIINFIRAIRPGEICSPFQRRGRDR